MKEKLFYTYEQTLRAFHKGSRSYSNESKHVSTRTFDDSTNLRNIYVPVLCIRFWFFTETSSRVNDLNKNNPITHVDLHILFFRGRYQRLNN
jgi:hypothetical protein